MIKLKDILLLIEQKYPGRIFKFGSKGPHVTKIQQALVDLGYDLGDFGDNNDGVDGRFGNQTEDAVEQFQKDVFPNKPKEWDGIVGSNTWTKLFISDIDNIIHQPDESPEEISFETDIPPIEGSYVAPKGDYDALHSFNRRRSDGFGGKLNSIVKREIQNIKRKYDIDQIDIIGIDIDINGKSFEVKWKVYVAPSTDGYSYEEIDSRGSAGGNAETRAKGQISGMHQYHTGTPVKLFTYNEKINSVHIYQIFYKYRS